jgi:hypothetical protein
VEFFESLFHDDKRYADEVSDTRDDDKRFKVGNIKINITKRIT